MIALAIVLVAFLLFSISNLFIGIYLWRKRFYIRKIRRIEETRRHFAEARNKLINLVIKNDIEVDSFTFKCFFNFNTHIMRRPDLYPEISTNLRRAFLVKPDRSSSDNPLFKEAKQWNDNIKEAVESTANAMFYLALIYSWRLRFILWLENNFKFLTIIKWLLEFIINKIGESNETTTEIEESRRSMLKLCRAI